MKILRYILMFVAVAGLGGCTQTDGNIDEWFGSWHIEEILINGEPDQVYADYQKENRYQVMVSFQGKVFNMAYIEGNEIYGSWSYAGEVLTLVAAYNAGSGNGTALFDPFPTVLHFPGDVDQVEITVTHISNRTMQWQLIDQNGRLLTYNLRKYP